MVNSALPEKKAIILRSQELNSKEQPNAFFSYKIRHNFKSIKAMKKRIITRSYVKPSRLKICDKFLRKLTRSKQIRRKKRRPSL